jgi:hypothetical protein
MWYLPFRNGNVSAHGIGLLSHGAVSSHPWAMVGNAQRQFWQLWQSWQRRIYKLLIPLSPQGLNPTLSAMSLIGAAFALYGRRFIRLAREGVQLPAGVGKFTCDCKDLSLNP